MKKTSFLILLSLSVSFFCSGKKSAVDYVNPMIGTALKGEGGTSPKWGPWLTFMMINLSWDFWHPTNRPYGWEITATSL